MTCVVRSAGTISPYEALKPRARLYWYVNAMSPRLSGSSACCAPTLPKQHARTKMAATPRRMSAHSAPQRRTGRFFGLSGWRSFQRTMNDAQELREVIVRRKVTLVGLCDQRFLPILGGHGNIGRRSRLARRLRRDELAAVERRKHDVVLVVA